MTNISDLSPKPKTVSISGNATIASGYGKFGSASLLCQDIGSFLYLDNNSDFNLSNSDYTIECWIKPSGDYSAKNTIITKRSEASGCAWGLYLDSGNGKLSFYNGVSYTGSLSPSTNSWNHIAAVLYTGNLSLYLNGTGILSTGISNSNVNAPIYIGNYPPLSEQYKGYIDDLRITKGVSGARYLTNFDPPTGPFATTGTPVTSPTSPLNPVATTGNATLSLSWSAPLDDNGADIINYAIEYIDDNDSVSYIQTNSTDLSYILSNLNNGTTYRARVAALNIIGTGSYSSTVSGTPGTIPSAPTQLSYSVINSGLSLSWTPSTDGGRPIVDYAIRYTSGGSANIQLTNSANSIYSLTGLTNGVSYVVDVAAINILGTGAYSQSVTGVPATFPSQPSALVLAYSTSGLNFSWSAPSNNGSAITDYLIQYSGNNDLSWTNYNDSVSTDTSIVLTGLVMENTYVARVAAINSIGTGLYSTASNSVFLTANPLPSEPTGVSATAGNRQASVSWGIPSSSGAAPISGYLIQHSNDDGESWITVNNAFTATTGLVTGLINGFSYKFQVAALNTIGTGPYSVPSSSVYLPTAITIVTQPSNQTSVNGQATFSITATVAGDAVLSYQWQKQEGGVGSFSDITGATSSSLVLSGLTNNNDNGDVYRCVLSATGEAITVNSNSVVLTVNAPVITITSQPSNQTAISGSATFSVTATVTEAATLSYQWEKQEGGAGSFSNVSGATSNSLSLSSLTNAADNGDVYRCVVSATGGATSVTSNSVTLTVSASSGPPAPTNLTAVAGDTSVALDWTAPANTTGITDYVIQYSTDGGTTWITYIPPPIITITQQPTVQVASGGAATFSVSATATEGGTLSYQWQKQESGTGAFTNVSGATSSSLSLTGLVYADDHSDKYRCVISALVAETNATSSKTSTAATLLIENPAGQPTPVLLATFDGNVLLDLGPNNYWLESALGGYSDNGSIADAYIVSNFLEDAAYISNNAAQVGPNYGSYFSLGIRTQVGRANFLSQISDGPFTIEMQYYPGGDLSTLQYSDEERYFKIGPYVVAGIKANSYYSQYGSPAYAHTAVYGDYIDSSTELCHTPVVLTPQSWNHIALVVDSNTVRLYINGSLACSGSTYPGSFSEFQVGGFYSNPFMSQVDNLRVVDSAIYTGDDIIVPTSASLTYTRTTNPTTELLLNATHGIEDWGKNRILLEHGPYWSAPGRSTYSPIVSTDQYKYGGASYYMDGTVCGLYPIDATYWNGQTAAIASLTSTLQNGPWTIEMWVRPTATLSYNSTPTGDPEQSGEAYWTLGFGPNNYIALYDNIYSGPIYDAENSTWLPPDAISTGVTLDYRVGGVSQRVNLPTSLSRNAWHHLAVVADTANGLLRLKVNGAEVGTIDISGSWSSKGAGYPGIDGLVIGELNNVLAGGNQYVGNTYNWFTGYIDDIRISSVALYGTGSYSVPTAALT